MSQTACKRGRPGVAASHEIMPSSSLSAALSSLDIPTGLEMKPLTIEAPSGTNQACLSLTRRL